ncbi:MAG TPA: hypothetical protein VKU80_10050 [Planctomycetota bacterium]|nr:hypothetical protein [Planctomycetota bacterium]
MPGAIQRVLNLLILTQLQAIKWIEEDEGRKAFGEQGGEQLNVALINSWQDLGALASRVIEPEQLDRLTTMVVNWRHENPDAEWLTSVRLDKIAQVEEGEAFVKSVGEGFAPPESTRRAVEELHLIAQQELFYLKRMPILLDWALEASLGSLTVVPKSSAGSGTIQGADVMLVDGFESVEGLPRCASQMIAVTEAIARAADHREIPGRKGTAVPVENRLRNEASLGAEAERSSLPSRMDASARQPIAQAQDSRELPAVVTRKNVDAVSNRSEPKVSGETLDVTNHMTWRVLMLVLLAVLLEVLRVVVRRIHRSGAPPTPIS